MAKNRSGKKGLKKKIGVIDTIRQMLTQKTGLGEVEGTGGRMRRQTIDEAVDAAVGNANKDAKRKR